MKRITTLLATAAAATAFAAAPASAAPAEDSPAADNASWNTFAVANCKGLEKNDFIEGRPEGAKPYPYTFYKSMVDNYEFIKNVNLDLVPAARAYFAANESLFVAKNRAGCVRVLDRIHNDGIAFPLFAPLPPMGPPQE